MGFQWIQLQNKTFSGISSPVRISVDWFQIMVEILIRTH